MCCTACRQSRNWPCFSARCSRAAEWLRPGGVLVYAVCSLEPGRRGAGRAFTALAPDPIAAEELPAASCPPGRLVAQRSGDGWPMRAASMDLLRCPLAQGLMLTP
jgi:hypothetical protein